MTIVIYLVLIIVPLIATGTLDKYLHPVKLVLDFICLLDICVTFNTGYTDYNAKEIILDRKLTKKYIFQQKSDNKWWWVCRPQRT